MKTLGDLLKEGKQELKFLGEEEAAAETEGFFTDVTGLKRSFLYLEKNREVSGEEHRLFREFLEQRRQRIPLQYITGKAYFWNEVLEVNRACLIPRPETEVLVERFIENSGWGRGESRSFWDLGCGAGAIGIALLRHFPRAGALLSDISAETLRVTRRNLKRYELTYRAGLLCGYLFESLKSRECGWDAIVSNPPYFSESDWQQVDPEIKWEPSYALDGGPDGLFFYRAIAEQAPRFLKKKGFVALETGHGQSSKVSGLLEANGFTHIKVFKDYTGTDRVILAWTE